MQAFTLAFIAGVGRPKSNSHGSVSWRLRSVRHSVWLFLRSRHRHGDGLHRGKYIANKFSEKKMTILGGSVFLIFAAVTLLQDPNAKMEKVDWRPNWMVADAAN